MRFLCLAFGMQQALCVCMDGPGQEQGFPRCCSRTLEARDPHRQCAGDCKQNKNEHNFKHFQPP